MWKNRVFFDVNGIKEEEKKQSVFLIIMAVVDVKKIRKGGSVQSNE